MNVNVGDLVDELKTLRKGRGILANQIDDRVGPTLRAVAAVADGDDPTEVRQKITELLRTLADALPDDLRIGVVAAFALDDDLRLPFYQDRVGWAARQLRRDQRTVRRRIDEGIARLAELAVGRVGSTLPAPTGAPGGWHTEELRVALALDLPTPEAFEFRRVVADRDHVTELDLALTLTSTPARDERISIEALGVDVFYGGRVIGRRQEATDRFGFVLRLPKPLRRNETHEFAVRCRPTGDRPMQPHYVCTPRHRCDLFDLRVRFAEDAPKLDIWLLSGGFQRDLDDPMATGDPITPDEVGEIRTQFRQLTPGLTYGLRWRPAADGECPTDEG